MKINLLSYAKHLELLVLKSFHFSISSYRVKFMRMKAIISLSCDIEIVVDVLSFVM
jgi:hypothetical protein